MKNTLTYKLALAGMAFILGNGLSAQQQGSSMAGNPATYETQERVDHYTKLKKMGYSEKEILEDLGNANFLAGNYGAAIYWYDKLKVISADGSLDYSYYKRYKHALKALNGSKVDDKGDWLAQIKDDYEIDESPKATASNFKPLDPYLGGASQSANKGFANGTRMTGDIENSKHWDADKMPISLTADGKTAFFSKTVYAKPQTGIFSKKELIHKIYRAKKSERTLG